MTAREGQVRHEAPAATGCAALPRGGSPLLPPGPVSGDGSAPETLVAALNELLEAERAGARVALHMGREASAALAPLVRAIQHDEARWCALLTQSIQRLGGTPSRRTGDFHEKAMAIEDLPARLAFLNRGQRWVVRKLQALLPRVQDPQLQAGLGAMLTAHEANIARVTAALDG